METYNVHLHKINEIVNNIEPNSHFVLTLSNIESSITWVRPNDNERVCVATDLYGEIAHAIVDMQSLTNLNQFNYVKNIGDRSLDLVLSNIDPESLQLVPADCALVVEDNHHPALAISLNTLPLKFIKEKRSCKPNFFCADYLELSTKLILINWVSLFYSLNANA